MQKRRATDQQTQLRRPLPARQPATADRSVVLAELKAVVHLGDVAPELLAELPGLYSSAFSTAEYFAIYDRPWRLHACELDEPRHVFAFTARGATVDVLNKVVDAEPAAVERLAAAIFRARPGTRRIRMEAKFPPHELGLPVRSTFHGDDLVVELPADEQAWELSLGAASRRNLHKYRNRLLREHPDFELRTVVGADITLALVEQVFAWNLQRILAKGQPWGYAGQPEAAYKAWRLLQSRGEVLCAYVGGECVAGWLLLYVGRDCWAHTAGFDPTYADLHLGFLMTAYTIAEGIRRGCARLHLLWGTTGYKRHLGAAPVTAWRISIFRSRVDRALYARERWAMLVRDRNNIYWRFRSRAKRRVITAAHRALGAA
jgi:CelD/BcsL family acetyltransferase involved in cellulose biosynthesis